MKRTEAERFWEKVDKQGPMIETRFDLGPCFLWTAVLTEYGYGKFALTRNADEKFRTVSAHIWVLTDAKIVIPKGYETDHLCHTLSSTCGGGKTCPHRACVSLLHLEVVTRHENMYRGLSPAAKCARQNYCKYGHEFTKDNVLERSDGGRRCKACEKIKHPGISANLREKCPSGHYYDELNTRIGPKGDRQCRACGRERARIDRLRNNH